MTGYCKSSINSIKSSLAKPSQPISALLVAEPALKTTIATVLIPSSSLFPCPPQEEVIVRRETTPHPPPECKEKEEMTKVHKERRKRVTREFWKAAGVPQKEWEWFLEFVESVSQKGSSNYSQKQLMSSTWEGAYKQYTKTAKEEGQTVRCDRWMIKWMKILGVKRGRFDRYKCKKCWLGKKALVRREKGQPREGDNELITDYELHKHKITTQTQLYRAQKANIRPGMFFAVFDYCTVHETAEFKLKDLNFTAFFYNTEKGEIVHRYFNYWSTSCKDYNFTAQVIY